MFIQIPKTIRFMSLLIFVRRRGRSRSLYTRARKGLKIAAINGLELVALVRRKKKNSGQEVELAVMEEIASPGLTGKYYLNFFRNLRSFIMLLRQKVKSARTWATQFHAKQKKKSKGSAGLKIGGAGHEQTKTVFDMMHHERSTVYSGN